MKKDKTCPVCMEEFDTSLNLAKHMVSKDRPSEEHQIWLQQFLGVPFEIYGFGNDKKIAIRLEKYWKKHKSWPLY